MSKYEIESKSGEVLGVYEAQSKQEALLASFRDAGYGDNIVWLDEDLQLTYLDLEYEALLGDTRNYYITKL